MSTKTEVKQIPRTVDNAELLNGIWRLKYKLTNRMGNAGFSGRLLSSYTDTMTGVPRHLYNEYGVMQPGYFIERQVTILEPILNPIHRNIVDWLIGHPKVAIENRSVNLGIEFAKKKHSNPRIELINLDYEEIDELLEEDFIDKIIGRISLDLGKNSIGIDSLRFILAKLNLSYIEMKYIKQAKIEKQKLRKRLKSYVRSSMKNAKEVLAILDNLASAKLEYEIKEMQRMEIINIANGYYKYEGNPLGTSLESVVSYFANNPDFYADLIVKLYELLRIEKT